MKQPIKMTPGDDTHLSLLMAPFSLNLFTGQDRQHLLGYGRAAFAAGHAQLRASTSEAAEELIEEIIERISDHAVKVVSHHEARKQGDADQIESARQAVFQADDWIKRDLRILAALAAPAAVAVPDDVRGALKFIHDTFKADLDAGYITRDKQFAIEIASAALAATPAAAPAWDGKLPERMQRALNELRIDCKTDVVSSLEFEVRSAFEGMHTSLATVKRLYHAAQKRLDSVDAAQADPFAAAAPVVLPEPVGAIAWNRDGTRPTFHAGCRDKELLRARLDEGLSGGPYRTEFAFTEQQVRALLATATGLPAQAVASIYVTEDGQRECDDWKVPLPVGRNLLYAAPQAQADARDAAFEAVRKKFCKLQRYSFFLDDKGNVRRTADYCGNWVEFEAVHTLFEPGSVDAAIAAAKGE